MAAPNLRNISAPDCVLNCEKASIGTDFSPYERADAGAAPSLYRNDRDLPPHPAPIQSPIPASTPAPTQNPSRTRSASAFITKAKAETIIRCAAYSFCVNRPLNCYLTIRLPDPALAHDQLTAFISHFRDWQAYTTGAPAYWVYTFEARELLHANLLLHVPPVLRKQFPCKLRSWAKQVGLRWQEGLIKQKALNNSGLECRDDDYLCAGLRGLLRYVLKGIAPEAASEFGIIPFPQGEIEGKRCGYSESLSPSKWNWDRAALVRHRILQLSWCDQSSGEYRPEIDFPLPLPPKARP